MAIKVTAKEWGSSIGVVIPSDLVKTEGIHAGDEIFLEIRKKNLVKRAFGLLKGKGLDAQRIKDELREEWS